MSWSADLRIRCIDSLRSPFGLLSVVFLALLGSAKTRSPATFQPPFIAHRRSQRVCGPERETPPAEWKRPAAGSEARAPRALRIEVPHSPEPMKFETTHLYFRASQTFKRNPSRTDWVLCSRLSATIRTADLFERLRRRIPEITDPHSGSLPALRHALLWVVGMRCARPWNPSTHDGLLTHPFRTFPAAPHQPCCGTSVHRPSAE
jgi:hypothetical protein